MNDPIDRFRRNMRTMRLNDGMSINDLAVVSGISPARIELIEAGRDFTPALVPSLAEAISLADVFRVGIDRMLVREEPRRTGDSDGPGRVSGGVRGGHGAAEDRVREDAPAAATGTDRVRDGLDDPRDPAVHDLTDLQRRIGLWGDATFGQSTNTSIVAHLIDEAAELRRAVSWHRSARINLLNEPEARESMIEEAADVLILLCQLAQRNRFDLAEAAEAKFARNQRRTWGKPDHRGVVKHVAEKEGSS